MASVTSGFAPTSWASARTLEITCATLCGALTSAVDFLKRAACMTKPPRSAIKATIFRSVASILERTSSRELQVTALFIFHSLFLSHNASHHRQQKAERGTSDAYCCPRGCDC